MKNQKSLHLEIYLDKFLSYTVCIRNPLQEGLKHETRSFYPFLRDNFSLLRSGPNPDPDLKHLINDLLLDSSFIIELSCRPCFGCFSPELVETVSQALQFGLDLGQPVVLDSSFIGEAL